MARNKSKIKPNDLALSVIEGIREKKGSGIVTMNLGKIKNSICDLYVICHGTSRTQVEAIAGGLEEYVRKNLGVKPWHSEGYDNAEWILIDYFDVVVHVFQKHVRDHYKLEDLWADAELKHYDTVE